MEAVGRAFHAAVSRRFAVLLSGVAMVLFVTGGGAEPAAADRSERPTIVLVHGAWADSTSWAATSRVLRDDGYRTVAPELALSSLSEDVATVRSTLDALPGPKVLVAHSYGGMVASAAAAGRSDVVGLVYSAAFVPDEGDSIVSLGAGFAPSEAFAHLAFTGTPFASPAYIAPDLFAHYFAQDLSATAAALLDAHQRSVNFSVVTTPSGPVAWHTVPCWYAISGADRMIDPAEEAFMASRAGCHTTTYAGASHVGGITRDADRFAELVEQAAGD